MPRRAPEHIATAIRKVEPVGDGLIRLYFAVPRGGAWDDQVSILMPSVSVTAAFHFAMTATGEISAECLIDDMPQQRRGMVS